MAKISDWIASATPYDGDEDDTEFEIECQQCGDPLDGHAIQIDSGDMVCDRCYDSEQDRHNPDAS